jgi:amino acid transporter
MTAASIAVLSFLGFDSISTLTEEVKGEKTGAGKMVGRAIIFSIPVIGSLFPANLVASLIVPDYTSFHTEGAFYEIAQIAGGRCRGITQRCYRPAWVLIRLVAQAIISRILYSMARDRIFTAVLAMVHSKYNAYVARFLQLYSLVIICGNRYC